MARRQPTPSSAADPRRFCTLPRQVERALAPDLDPGRARLIRLVEDKWVNGTKLEYSLGSGGKAAEHQVIRNAFAAWKALGIGLEFDEVADSAEHIRIGFDRSDGSWSYVGREILKHDQNMNFGWDISNDIDTALHEIGHALGFPHEHQNPNAGIVWNEEAVYAALARPPNRWPRATTFHNIIRKIPINEVRGSSWDPNSIMHYPFEAGLIKEPQAYRNGLRPAGGLSALDKRFVKEFYPPLTQKDHVKLTPFKSVQVTINPGQQLNFLIEPPRTRNYTMKTLGMSDTVLALFEDVPGAGPRYLSADDDSGTSRNASITFKLLNGRRYILRARLYWAERKGEAGIVLS